MPAAPTRLRTQGKGFALAVVLIDVLKVVLPVLLLTGAALPGVGSRRVGRARDRGGRDRGRRRASATSGPCISAFAAARAWPRCSAPTASIQPLLLAGRGAGLGGAAVAAARLRRAGHQCSPRPWRQSGWRSTGQPAATAVLVRPPDGRPRRLDAPRQHSRACVPAPRTGCIRGLAGPPPVNYNRGACCARSRRAHRCRVRRSGASSASAARRSGRPPAAWTRSACRSRPCPGAAIGMASSR
jgi:hypothetical protein